MHVTGPEQPEGSSIAASVKARLQASHRSASLILVVLLVSLVMYCGIAFVIIEEPTIAELAPAWKVMAVSGAGLAAAVLAVLVRRRNQSADRIDDVFHERGMMGLIAHLVTSTIISGLLAELAGIIGLAGGIALKDQWLTLRLCVIAIIVAAMSYPRMSAWQRAVSYYSSAEPSPQMAAEIKMKGIY